MPDSYRFAVDVFRTICDRLAGKAAELRLLVEAGTSFEEWLVREAFLACKARQEGDPFCEVAAGPTYASEGVPAEGDPDRDAGDLRVGGPDDGADHCWVFAEFVLLHAGGRLSTGWLRAVERKADKLRRLGWKKSASLLVVAVASRGDVAEWADALVGCAAWNQPALTEPVVVPLPGGGTVVLKAVDVKRDPAHALTTPAR
ncbi:MAG: hypothetical protein K2P78_07775 [Gemmataceae bacterium]|nr:hypothetical protein [Gemmataceae bacterium]